MNRVDDLQDRFFGVMILSAESRKYPDEGIGWDARQLRYCDEFVSKCLLPGKIFVIRDRIPYLLPIPGYLEALFRTGMSEWNSKSDTSKRDEFRSLKSSSIKMILPALSVAGFLLENWILFLGLKDDVTWESGESPEHYQGAVMRSGISYATDEGREGECRVEAESEYNV